jgi:hypothetical protein
MVFCVRKAVFAEKLDLPPITGLQFKSLGVPIELGLPFDFDHFRAIEQWLPRIADEILDNSVHCVSIHAPEGPVVGFDPDGFLAWTRGMREFADKIGARIIVFHPLRVSSTSYDQSLKLLSNNIKALQQETVATVALETFKGGAYFDYKDLIGAGLPICLDTSHVSHQEALDVVGKCPEQIRHIHLSRATGSLTHLPAKKCEFGVVERLIGRQPSIAVCLEYLDRYASEMVRDCKRFTDGSDYT